MTNTVTDKHFGLRHIATGNIVGFYTQQTSGDGVSEQHILCHDTGIRSWYTDDKELAEYVRNNSTPWYNADYGTPTHSYEPEEIEVVLIKIATTVSKVNVKLPTAYEFYRSKYEKKEPRHWDSIQDDLKSGRITYGWYDYAIHRDEQKRKAEKAKKRVKK